MKNRNIIAYIVILIAIIGLIVLLSLAEPTEAETEPIEEPQVAGISLTGEEVAFLAKILHNPNYQPDINEWRTNGEMITLLQKLQDYSQTIATGTYNQQIIKLNELIQ